MTISYRASMMALAVFAVTAAAPIHAQTFGSTTADNAIGPFGRDGLLTGVTGTVGQTFATPTGSPTLEAFTFFLSDYFGGSALLVQASIFEFAVDHIVGTSLFTSAIQAGSANIAGYDPLAFTGVNLLLNAGTTYVLLLRTASTSPDGSTNFVGTTSAESFALGQLFTSEATTNAALSVAGAMTQSTAATFGTDAAIQMTFGAAPVSAVPEPGSLVLLATGLVGIAGIARHRRQSRG